MGIIKFIRNAANLGKTVKKYNISIRDIDSLIEHNSLSPTSSGIYVSQEKALTIAAFYDGIRQISQIIATLPCVLYKRVADNRRLPYKEHPLYKMLLYKVSDRMSSFTFFETMQMHLIIRGNAYAYISRDAGLRVDKLIIIDPQKIEPKLHDDGTVYFEYKDSQRSIIFRNEEIFHVMATSYDGIKGLGVLELAREDLGTALAERKHNDSFLKNGANANGVLEIPGNLDSERREELRKALEKKYTGADNAYKTMILEGGMKYNKIQVTPEESQFIESRIFSIQEIARWLNMPPHKLKELSRATYDNITSEQISYITDTLAPWLKRWETAIITQLLGKHQWGYAYAEFSVDTLLRTDIKSRNEALRIAHQEGVITSNEWRAKLNMNPIDDERADLTWKPMNMEFVGDNNSESEGDNDDTIQE